MQNRTPRALISVTDKTLLEYLGRELVLLGFELISTGGTARALQGFGLPVTTVEEVTGFPEMMDGRLKTLHPKIFGGILARGGHEGDMAALESQSIKLIDVVIVNLYEFAKAAADSDKPFDELVEQIDIGGPSLLRAAAKNWRRVYAVFNPGEYEGLMASLRNNDPNSRESLELRHYLAGEVFRYTTSYDADVATEFDSTTFEDGVVTR